MFWCAAAWVSYSVAGERMPWLTVHVALPMIILMSAVVGAIVGIGLILFKGRDHNQPMPFGPFLAAAGWLTLLWGQDIIGLYLR